MMGRFVTFLLFLANASCLFAGEKYTIPPEYGPKKAVLISVHCQQLDKFHDEAEEYLIKTIAYSLTRSDVYLEMCNSLLMRGVLPIDLENFDEDQFRINQQKLDSINKEHGQLTIEDIKASPERTEDFLEDIAEEHTKALEIVKGQTHRLFMYTNPSFGDDRGVNVYIRDRSIMPVQRADGSRFFINMIGTRGSALNYMSHFILSSELTKIPTLPISVEPSSLVMDQGNIFMSAAYVNKKFSQKADENNCQKVRKEIGEEICSDGLQNVLHNYFDFKNLIFLDTNVNESTGHIDTLIKFVINPKTKKTEVLLSTTPITFFSTYESPMKTHIATYHENKNRDQKNKKRLEELGYVVHEVPTSGHYSDGHPFTAGYINSLILDDVVLVPQYISDYMYDKAGLEKVKKTHDDAVQVYKKFFRHVVSIPIEHHVRSAYGGAIHCLTSDIPE